MKHLDHRLILASCGRDRWQVTSPDFPPYLNFIYGLYVEEAVDRATREFRSWVAHQRKTGKRVPKGRGGSVTIQLNNEGHLSHDFRLLSRHELSQATGLSLSTIDRRCLDGTLPFIRIGRRVLFDQQKVMEKLERVAS